MLGPRRTAAKESAASVNRSLLIVDRARIYVPVFSFIETNSGTYFRYKFTVVNNGPTPGTIYSRQFTYFPTNAPLHKVPPCKGEPIEQELAGHPGQSIPFDGESTHPLPKDKDVFVFGALKYRDVFGNEQTTRCAAQYIRTDNSAAMVTQPGYNNST
jgi:hypothetical protein